MRIRESWAHHEPGISIRRFGEHGTLLIVHMEREILGEGTSIH